MNRRTVNQICISACVYHVHRPDNGGIASLLQRPASIPLPRRFAVHVNHAPKSSILLAHQHFNFVRECPKSVTVTIEKVQLNACFPNGMSVLFPINRRNGSLWMLEGFDQPGWANELRETLPWARAVKENVPSHGGYDGLTSAYPQFDTGCLVNQ